MARAIRKYSKDFVALILLAVIALVVAGYIFANQNSRPSVPLIEKKPIKLRFEFSDCQAVTPGQGQTVRVAGVEVGKIRNVKVRNGVCVVESQIDGKFWPKIQVRTDATALLRPRTGLKDMFVELDPGLHGARVTDGYTIPVENTAPDIDPDETLSAFDTDTRAYLQLLINGAGKGFVHRGNNLNRIFKSLGPTNRDLNRVTAAVAQRKSDLKELIHRYGDLTNTLADKDREIRTLVSASDAVFRSFASQQNNISLAVAKLAPTLNQTSTTLTKANTFARILGPTLNSLRPAFRQLDTTNAEILDFLRSKPNPTSIVRTKIRPFVRVARPPIRNLRPAAVNLARATPDFTKSFHELNRFFNMLAYNPNGAEPVTNDAAANKNRDEGYLFWLAWVGMNTDSMFSTSDANGPFRRALAGFDCATIRQQVVANPAGGPLIGLTNALNDPGLCGGQGSGTNLPGVPVGLPIPKGGAKKAVQTDGKQTAGTGPAEAPGKKGKP